MKCFRGVPLSGHRKKEREHTTQGRDGRTARRHHTGILRRGDSQPPCSFLFFFIFPVMVLVQPCTRSQAFGLCLLNLATFPSELPRWRQLPGDWLSLQRRLRINHVLVATSEEESGHILGSVEVHSPQYQQRLAGGAYSPEQLARLQPYLASLAVREGARGRGVGQSLVEAAVEAVRSSDYAG